MTQKELITQVSTSLSSKGDAMHISRTAVGHVLDALGDVAAAELLGGGSVPLPGLGKLKTKQQTARVGRNPRTGEAIQIAARRAVRFEAGKELKEALK